MIVAFETRREQKCVYFGLTQKIFFFEYVANI